MLVKQTQYRSLEAVDHELVFLLQICSLQLQVAMVKDPHYFPIGELVDIELTELCLDAWHLWRDVADWHVLERPMATCEDLCIKLNIFDVVLTIALLIAEIFYSVLWLYYVSEHRFHFADSIVSTLYLKTLYHPLLSIVRHWCLVKESVGQQVGVRLNEDITTVEAAEQLNDCFNF